MFVFVPDGQILQDLFKHSLIKNERILVALELELFMLDGMI